MTLRLGAVMNASEPPPPQDKHTQQVLMPSASAFSHTQQTPYIDPFQVRLNFLFDDVTTQSKALCLCV